MKGVKRPWGSFKRFALNEVCTVKILELKPKAMLSLQVHKKRNEEWYFFDKALVQIGNEVKKVRPGEIVKIKKGKMHRVMAGWKKVRFLEISRGKFDEKDEMRLYDEYGRK
jgi:mannose-6-phosphate isomerase